MELHGGTITAGSAPGQGTRMRVRLPLAPVGSILQDPSEDKWAPDGQEPETETPAFPVVSPVEAPIVLLIEDNQDLQDYLHKHLAADFRVHQAYDGDTGLRLAEELVPDLIVSDVMMPGKDGFAVVKTIRQNPVLSHIPVILLTARSSEQDMLKGLEHLADVYLVKPFKIEQLRVNIFTLLENRALVAQRYAETWYNSPEAGQIRSEDQEFMADVRGLVQDNIDNQDCTVQDMADALFMSRRQFERKIKSLTNMSPGELLRTFRMKMAKEMLSKGQFTSVQEVAQAVGYPDPSYFSRLFKKEFNAPPSEFLQNR